MHHLAIVTTEILPPFSQPCAGGGVRIWGMSESLRQQGIECTYFLPDTLREAQNTNSQIPIVFFKPEHLHEKIKEKSPEAVLFEQWQPMTFLKKSFDIPVLVDLPGPLILEYYWRDPECFYQHIVHKINAFSKADYFLCALERQRGYYTAWLTWAGIPPDSERVEVIPFHLHEMPRSRQGHVEDEAQIFWGGMFWPWQQRDKPLQITLQTMTRLRHGQLVLCGGNPGDQSSPFDPYMEHDHVTWLGRLVFSEYVAELKRATISLDLSFPTEERRLSSDLRTGTALWAGTPCVVTPHSPWATMIKEHNAGWVVEYDNEKGLVLILEEVILERGDIVAKRRGARNISNIISSESNLKPLLKFLKNPTLRDKNPPFFEARFQEREERYAQLQEEINRLRHEKESLQHDLNAIRSNPLYRLYKTISPKK